MAIPNDSYRYISLSGPALFRADSRYPPKLRSYLNKDNRVVEIVVDSYICMMMQPCTQVHSYGNTVMDFHTVLITYEYPLLYFNKEKYYYSYLKRHGMNI